LNEEKGDQDPPQHKVKITVQQGSRSTFGSGPHSIQNSGASEAQNGAVDGLGLSQWRRGVSK
jgi:hypothetical protein